MAGAEGLEPSTKVLETHVLPLHHAPMHITCNEKEYNTAGSVCQGLREIFFSVMHGGGVSRGGGLYEAGWLWYNHPDEVWRVRA